VLRGIAYGVIGVAILAGLAVIAKAAHWQFKLPSHALLRYGVNFTFTAILEEGFYRGFIQSQLTNYLKGRKYLALVIASVIFTFAHVYWSPSVAIMAFVFLASLIYGGVFLISGKVESAIVTHFLLNFIHMTFFSYHAM
jgi:membrane protease YdiL (CAAX protease family)